MCLRSSITAAITTLATGSLILGAVAISQPASAKEPLFSSFSDRLKSTSNEAFFEEARKVLGEEMYPVYRIIERIARANGLDDHPWRVRLVANYEVNASASEMNTLTFMFGLLDQLHGDNAALACVVGHEMAHHTQEHIPTTVAVRARMEQLSQEAEAEAIAEIQAAERNQQATGLLGDIARTVGINVGGYEGVIIGDATGDVLDQLSETQRQQAEARAAQIYAEKVASLEAEVSSVLQSHELEADEYGYKYMVRAGFDPEGCFRMMEVLSRGESSQLPSFSHPNPADRIEYLEALQDEFPKRALLDEGKVFLAASPQPLGYALSRDLVSLRIESRFATNGSGFPE